jgi:hypothetical protein
MVRCTFDRCKMRLARDRCRGQTPLFLWREKPTMLTAWQPRAAEGKSSEASGLS